MASRYDAVLAAIPVVLAGGLVGRSAVESPSAVAPLSATMEQFPLLLAGVVAWLLVGRELVRLTE